MDYKYKAVKIAVQNYLESIPNCNLYKLLYNYSRKETRIIIEKPVTINNIYSFDIIEDIIVICNSCINENAISKIVDNAIGEFRAYLPYDTRILEEGIDAFSDAADDYDKILLKIIIYSALFLSIDGEHVSVKSIDANLKNVLGDDFLFLHHYITELHDDFNDIIMNMSMSTMQRFSLYDTVYSVCSIDKVDAVINNINERKQQDLNNYLHKDKEFKDAIYKFVYFAKDNVYHESMKSASICTIAYGNDLDLFSIFISSSIAESFKRIQQSAKELGILLKGNAVVINDHCKYLDEIFSKQQGR